MAHHCPDCGLTCHCGGDIDDLMLNVDEYVNACTHCETDQGDDEVYDYYEDDEDEPCCHYCGKVFEDFSDLGCQYCDRRHPHYGVL